MLNTSDEIPGYTAPASGLYLEKIEYWYFIKKIITKMQILFDFLVLITYNFNRYILFVGIC
jgi:hypothetical protein